MILGPKRSIYSKQALFLEKTFFKFHVPFGPFYCAELKKIDRVDPEL